MSKSKTRKARPLAERQPVSPADSTRPPGKEAAGSFQHPREGSKQAIVVGLLRRPKGASLDDLVGATGWLPHTTRAALTGLRRRGFAIERVPADDGRSLYRAAAATAERPAENPGRRRGTAKPRLRRGAEQMTRRSTGVAGSHATASSSGKAEAELSRLASADVHSLRRRWRVLFGRAAPDLPRALLSRIIAYRIQADAVGDLDPAIVKLLDRLGRGEIDEISLPELRAVKPGTLLVREWAGALQRVMVLEQGFAWNGSTYDSLSQVARAITGTNWNGPRFFGLRDRARPSP